jgi:hypothetical protein
MANHIREWKSSGRNRGVHINAGSILISLILEIARFDATSTNGID